MINSKQCSACEIVKPVSEFYRQADRADSLRGDCKKCHVAETKRNRQIDNQKWLRKLGIAREKDPRKHKAVQLTTNRLKRGEIVRPGNCSKCHKECKPEGHHADYNKPLEIEWLCSVCHGEWHQNNRAI